MYPTDTHVREVFLEKLQFQLQQVFTMEVLARVDHDVLTQHVVARLRAGIFAHKEAIDDVDVPVTAYMPSFTAPTHVMVELPRTRWQRLTRQPSVKQWLPVVGEATAEIDGPILVRGKAHVRANYFRMFPEPKIRFPDKLGPVVMHAQAELPDEFAPASEGWWK
jgi:hypothetical protein